MMCHPRARSAARMTSGTKTWEMRSTSRWTGALRDCASLTSRAMPASVVSWPTRCASMIRRPEAFMVAPVTILPGETSTGRDSPVSMDSSTAEVPDTTTPSVAMRSPGRTTNCSPTCSCSIGMRTSWESRRTATSFAPRLRSSCNACEERPFARASNQRPSSKKTITMAEVSR